MVGLELLIPNQVLHGLPTEPARQPSIGLFIMNPSWSAELPQSVEPAALNLGVVSSRPPELLFT